MKKVFTLILALVMAMSLVACGGSSSEESSGGDGGEASGGYKIGFSNFSIGNSWRQQMEADSFTEQTSSRLKASSPTT